MVRKTLAVVAALLLGGTSLSLVGAGGDPLELTVDRGPGPGEVTLSWTGGTPSFEVYRSSEAEIVTASESWIGTTDQQDWVDSPPDSPLWYYRVLECPPCAPCGGAADVPSPGGRFDVMLTKAKDAGSCGGSGVEGALTFTLATPADVFITTHQAGGVDTVLYVREGNCDGAEIACNDDADGRSTSSLSLASLAAGSYTVFIDSKTTAAGTLPVDIYITPPGQASDMCGRPTWIPPGTSSVSGQTCGFAADYQPVTSTDCPFSGSGGAEDRVFYFYLEAEGSVSFSGCNTGSNYDQTIYIRSVCTGGEQPACDDDGCPGPLFCSSGLRSSMTAPLQAGLYYLFIDGNSDSVCSCGDYEFSISP